jgi:hypothetical protein
LKVFGLKIRGIGLEKNAWVNEKCHSELWK